MFVTLEVSRLSGWLNALAFCRESKEGRAMQGEVQTGRPEVGGRPRCTRRACRRGLDCKLGARHGEARTQNIDPMFVTLEVSRLSGWLNADAPCREWKEGHAMRRRLQTRRPEVAADRGARGVQERARLQIGRRARGEAHVEHVAHVCDAGGVEAQRLVERPRLLPRVERRTCGVGRGARVGGQQAVDDRGGKQRAGEGATADWGAGHGEERTENIPPMFVTLEVSRLSGWLNAAATCRESKEGHAVRGAVYGSRGSRRWTTAASSSVQGWARLQIEGQGTGRSSRRTCSACL
eukprot:scaffold35033_cov54-Phaeocystis_antarctica.AAC.2